MKTMRVLALSTMGLAACFAGTLDLTGKACPCPEGYSCHPELGCIRGGGGSAGGCVDGDLDGSSACDDCDDADPLTYPGAPEICGDGVANDCGDDADPPAVCQGKGAFVAPVAWCDDAVGTKATPVCSIHQGMVHAALFGGGHDVYVAEGLYQEAIALSTDGMSLVGGWCCSERPCSWTRDIAQCVSTLQNVGPNALAFGPAITRKTALDGFRLVGAGSGEVALIELVQATPIIRNNALEAADLAGDGRSIAIAVGGSPNDPQGALIEVNDIQLATTPWMNGGGRAIGIHVEAAVEIVDNHIWDGAGNEVDAIECLGTNEAVLIRGNTIDGGESVNGSAHAIELAACNSVTIEANRINSGTTFGSCGGVYPMWSCATLSLLVSTATIRNNYVMAAGGSQSAAVYIYESDGPEPAGNALIDSNVLHGGASGFAEISAAIVLGSPINGKNTVAGRIRNNILLGGSGGESYGIYEASGMGATLIPVDVLHNDIVAQTPYRAWNGSTATAHGIASLNALSFADGNFDADCLLASDGYHIALGSPCIDAGIALAETAAIDIDGELRPLGAGFDVGADEVP